MLFRSLDVMRRQYAQMSEARALLEATLRDTTESADLAGAALRRAKADIDALRNDHAQLSEARARVEATLHATSEAAEQTAAVLRQTKTELEQVRQEREQLAAAKTQLTATLQTTTEESSAALRAAHRDRKSTRLNSSHERLSRMPSSA